MAEFLTDEEAALIWSGQSSSLANLETDPVEEKKDTSLVEEKKEDSPLAIDDKALDSIFHESDEDDDEEEETEEVVTTTETAKPEEAKPSKGRKPTDLLTLVSQLVDEEVLKPFEEGIELKTIEDAKDLIKLNLQSKAEDAKDEWWNTKVSGYSRQVQAILHYAEQGGTDIAPLLTAIAKVEETADLSVENAKGQEEIVRQVLQQKGFDDDEIEDQITTLKDLDKLKSKAEKFLPELRTMEQQRVQMLMRQQEEREIEAREATRNYLTTVQETLNKESIKGMKLQREDKSKIYESLANARHTSLNGTPTNGFVKTLEELQFGKNADYEQFLNIVHFTVDPQGFIEKLKTSIKNDVSAETVKRLKSSKTTTANTEETYDNRLPRKTVARSEFKNPFS